MKKTKTEKIVFTIVFCIFIAYTIYILFPLLFAFNSALKADGGDVLTYAEKLSIPPHFENFIEALKSLKVGKTSFFMMVVNSLIYSCGTTFLGIMSSTFLAYAVSKYEFKLKGFLYALALFVMTIPIYGSAPAHYKLIKWLQWDNTWFYLLSTAGAFGFNFIVIHSFFEGVSKEYSEAAFMDGAGHFLVFFKIMLPMALPSIMAVVITSFIGSWNDYMTPLLYLKKMPTLASGLYVFKVDMANYKASDHYYFAGVLISLIPVVALFLAFQNTIMEKVYAGGLKG